MALTKACSPWTKVIAFLDVLLTVVCAEEPQNKDEPEVTFAIIGLGIGVFLTLCFICIKLYMLRRHMNDNNLSEVNSGNMLIVLKSPEGAASRNE